jgi:ribosomal-protein-alanine N-acetyltransferase
LRRPIISNFLNTPPTLTGDKVRLRPKRLRDALNDYKWRKDAELCRLDATQPTTSSFEEFLKLVAGAPSYSNKSCHFAIETLDGKHIGNCSYFDIDEANGDAEIGMMIGDKAYWNQCYGTDAMRTVLNYIFSQTSLKRIHLKTLDWNIRAQKCFEKCGFTSCGNLTQGKHSFILMEICRSDTSQNRLKK